MDRFDWLELDRAAAAESGERFHPRREPHDAPSFYRAGREMREHGYFKTAATFYEKAIGFNDQHYDAWVELVDTLVRIKDLSRADAISKEAVDNYRLVRPLYAARALVLAHLGNFQEARHHSRIGVDPEKPSWYAFCTHAEIILKEDPERRLEALEIYEQAMDCAESLWEPPFLAGWALLEAGFPALSAGMFAEAAHHNPRAPICWLGLGDSFRALRMYDQALFYYQRVTEIEPRHEAALERQRKCTGLPFGLMGVFNNRLLSGRWKKKFQKALKEWGPRQP
jgi:tetratricopeptide (TPR) repeat protein